MVIDMNEEQFDTLVRNRGFLDGTVAVKKRLRLHYMQIQHTIAMSPLGNTGEGVLMAQKVGAALWHMWHVRGGNGFKVPGLPIAVRHRFSLDNA